MYEMISHNVHYNRYKYIKQYCTFTNYVQMLRVIFVIHSYSLKFTISGVTKSVEEFLKHGKHAPISLTIYKYFIIELAADIVQNGSVSQYATRHLTFTSKKLASPNLHLPCIISIDTREYNTLKFKNYNCGKSNNFYSILQFSGNSTKC